MDDLRLVKPRVKYRAEFMAMVADFAAAGETSFQPIMTLLEKDFARFVDRFYTVEQGLNLPPGWVPQSVFWSLKPDLPMVVGTIRLSHRLTPALSKEGGHIGYNIAPSHRGKGYGTRQLALVLEIARDMGLDRVLITCDTDNIASARVIQKNGGILCNEVISDHSGKPVSRYWVDLS